jgi:hypothetical protein
MAQLFFIAIAAGAASALLLASYLSGSPFAVLLVLIAPLPILIAAIGWHHVAGLLAAITAAAALAAILSLYFAVTFQFSVAFHSFAAFMVAFGFPAWWLGYLALLGRPGAGPGETEWYPVGRLVVWTAVLGAAVVTMALLNFGTDAETLRQNLRRAFEQVIRIYARTPADAPLQFPGTSDPNRALDLLVAMFPPTTAIFATVMNLINLWLAGLIVRISGRLRRPWPDLAAMRFPPLVAGGLAAAIAGSFVDGLVGIIAGVFATTLLICFALLGFAIVHKITHGMNGRGFILLGVYLAVGIFGWPVLVMVLLGLADAVFDIREFFANRRGPPAPLT